MKKSFPDIKEISVDSVEDGDSKTIVLKIKNSMEPEYQGAIGCSDVGNLVASLITSVGGALSENEAPFRSSELASTRVFISGAGIGFGNTVAGPVLVAQTGGLALIFSMTSRDLFDMAKKILEDLDTIEEIDGPPRHH